MPVMEKIKKGTRDLKEELRTDPTLNTWWGYSKAIPPKFLPWASEYLLDKVPIVQWLPRYNPAWLVQDFVAGLTIGVMLIPQGLSYAKIATIPIENGLYSSWIPAALCVIMGTSKDLSTGPTSILGLLTSDIIKSLKNEYTPTEISTAVAMFVGIYGLVVGCLELGFLLDYVSAPVLTGFISATALTIGFGQVDSLVGLDDVPDKIFPIIGNVLRRLPHWDGPTCGVGFGSVAILLGLEQFGKYFGKKHWLIKYVVSSRAVIVMVLFTLISWGVNHGRDESDYFFEVSEVDTHGIGTPRVPDAALLGKVGARAFAPFIACALEHLAVGKAFGRRNHYAIDQSQEITYLGVTNIVNSFFSVMPVGGAMSRTAVNSECGVKSPLYGLVTACWIVLTLFVFSPALYWLPKATLAAIIIMAVIHLFGPLSLFWRYWRVSLADFIASQVSFWVTIFLTAEYGIGGAVAWSILWTMLRSAFVKPEIRIRPNDSSYSPSSSPPTTDGGVPPSYDNGEGNNNDTVLENPSPKIPLPDDTALIRLTDNLFFPNASRAKATILQRLQLVYPSAASTDQLPRTWSVASQRKLEGLRAANPGMAKAHRLRVLVWDFTTVAFVDVTGIIALSELKDDIHRQLGSHVQIRMVGIGGGGGGGAAAGNKEVRRRFERAGWKLRDDLDGGGGGAVDGGGGAGRGEVSDCDNDDDDVEKGGKGAAGRAVEGKEGDVVYTSLERAIWDREGTPVLEGVAAEKS